MAFLGADATAPIEACGYFELPVLSRETTPRAEGLLRGQLGLLRPGYKSEFLVIAYRHLVGVGLSAEEQTSFVVAQGKPSRDGTQSWLRARIEAGFVSPDYLDTELPGGTFYTPNCLPNAFETATVTLKVRAQAWGVNSPEFRHWLVTQDAVFEACSGKSTALPPNLYASHAVLGKDYTYQAASHAFYRGDWAFAERAFTQIGNDPDSAWRPLARYLQGRTLVRRALTEDPADVSALDRARRVFEAIASDTERPEWHHAARDYVRLIRTRREPSALFAELSRELATANLGAQFGQSALDYAWLRQRNVVTAGTTEPLEALEVWLRAMQSPTPELQTLARAAFERTRSAAWLVAILGSASAADVPELQGALEFAASLPASHPAFVTARYHRARLLLEAGAAKPELHTSLQHALSAVAAEDRSTLNELTQLSLWTAPDLVALAAHLTVVPAGYSDGSLVLTEPKTEAEAHFYPESARVLNTELTLDELLQVARLGATENSTRPSTRLPRAAREQLLSTLWLRSQVLGRADVAQAAQSQLQLVSPRVASALEPVQRAPNERERNLEFAYALTQHPWWSIQLEPWSAPLQSPAIDTAYANYLWCAHPAREAPKVWGKGRGLPSEQQRLRQAGAGISYLVARVLEAQRAFPADPRIPQMLHRAVRISRYACRDATTTDASRRAFQVLKRNYPDSPWAKQTKYYY